MREFYASTSGDRWLLVRDDDTGHVSVRHEPNRPSGGRASRIEIADFLTSGADSPEKRALLRLIGSLVD